ncbi:MAG: hypothetical protein OQL06_01740 [Gammaproteobacteria bacterium]|nr:hypothetical protein [Gammaproteobacteria bacterium]
MRPLLLLMTLVMSSASFATPEIRLCLDGDCNIKQTIKLSDPAWVEILQLFESPVENDSVERQYIAKAIMLMETDALHRLAEKSSDASTTEIRNWMNDRDMALNIKSYISTLLDAKLIKFHFIRKIEQRSSWFGMTENVCVIQATTSGKIYVIKASENHLTVPEIESLASWKQNKYLPGDLGNIFSASEKFPNDANTITNE